MGVRTFLEMLYNWNVEMTTKFIYLLKSLTCTLNTGQFMPCKLHINRAVENLTAGDKAAGHTRASRPQHRGGVGQALPRCVLQGAQQTQQRSPYSPAVITNQQRLRALPHVPRGETNPSGQLWSGPVVP